MITQLFKIVFSIKAAHSVKAECAFYKFHMLFLCIPTIIRKVLDYYAASWFIL